MSAWTTVVLSGGASTRMGRDKATLELAGKSLLDRTIECIPDDVPIIVSGPEVPVARNGVRFVREEPPGGGPVAGLDAALPHVETPVVVVLAADLPFVGTAPKHLAEDLLNSVGDEEVPRADVVRATGADGHPQHLCAAYRTDPLRRAIRENGDVHGASMRSVVERLYGITVSTIGASPSDDPTEAFDTLPPPTFDVDTPDDLAVAARQFVDDGEANEPRADGEWSKYE